MERIKKILQGPGAVRYAALLVLLGLVMLLLPGKQFASDDGENTEEARLESLLCQIEGVGELSVLLSENGAAVVCGGAENAEIQLEICRAVSCYTGLDSNKIQVFKMQAN